MKKRGKKATRSPVRPTARVESDVKPGAPPRPAARAAFPIVGIGASAGGLEAISQLLRELPADTGMAFVVIQHLDRKHSSLLGEALAKATKMAVGEPDDQTVVEPDRVYVIPSGADISIADGRLQLVPRSEQGKLHLPVDSFLRSLAAERGSLAIGVVLSGTGSDGTEGLRAIKAADGITLAQDPSSAKFAGMPRSALDAGVVDHCLKIPELAAALNRLSRHSYFARRRTPSPRSDGAALEELFVAVRNAVGVDFSQYKPSTFERRLARRMALRGAESIRGYVDLLKAEPDEARLLFEDVLIHVTSFFREPELFDHLKTTVFPAIARHKEAGASIRLWVAGCSTGEEVYSLAICLVESMGASAKRIQIFGSDASETAIDKARAATYTDAVMRDVSDERRRKYFSRVDRGYRIHKAVRDLCVFVQHDLGRDPPFSKIDLISCRNVLIYFDTSLQRRVIPTFHYALRELGFLVLGGSESLAGFGQLFSPVDVTNKIFARTAFASAPRFAPPTAFGRRDLHPRDRAFGDDAGPDVDVAKHLDHLLLARYAPPGVLVDDKLQILQFRGQTGAYLQPAPGAPKNDLLEMVRPGLFAPLRAAFAESKRTMAPVRRERVEVDQDGTTRRCDVVVMPYVGLPGSDQLFVVLFEPHGLAARERRVGPRSAAERRRNAKLEHELAATQEYLRSLNEEHVRAHDDLGAANEELISGNEELQSMNEELETAKEELQSINEELTTVNDELHSRNQEVSLMNSDLVNLIDAVDIPMLILDGARRIRRFTPTARSILNVVPADIGRPLGDIRPNIVVEDLDAQIVDVVETMAIKEEEVQDQGGRWYRLRIRPYKTTDDKIDGAILSLVDIDALKHHIGEAQEARAEAERANGAKDEFLAVVSHELRTPLSSTLVQAQLLRQPNVDRAKIERASEAIERGAKLQVKLIDDLLDVARIVNGKLRMESNVVDLREVVREAIDGASAAAAKKSIAVSLVVDGAIGEVQGDSTRLTQVVSNLLTNAVKFTPAGGTVKVALAVVDGQARLTVTDTGIGIDPSFLAHLFQRFAQEDSSMTRTFGGLGLGLAIVRHIVEAHGGGVRASSLGKGAGATFTVELPLIGARRGAESSAPAARAPATLAEDPRNAGDPELLRGLRVLVVDDDASAADAVAAMLQQRGARVAVADSAVEARAVVKQFRPDVLVCDLAMPDEDGYQLIRRIRGLGPDSGAHVPALALTALASDADRRRAISAGFQMHLTKPIDIERLTHAVGTLLKSASGSLEPSEESPAPRHDGDRPS